MKFFGLLGKNISYSFSPILHSIISQKINLDLEYKIFDLDEDEIKTLLKKIKNNEISGINITIPYKEKIKNFIENVSDEAKEIGAVNCIASFDNKICGFNTDYYGIIESFKKMGANLKNKKVYILGTGGAAKTCQKVCKDLGGFPILVSRNTINSSKNIITYEELMKRSGYMLINATPVGTFPNVHISPVSQEIIQNFDFIFDLVYNPLETKFIKIGKSLGKTTLNGLYMLVVQGVKAQEIWNNIEIEYEPIYQKILELKTND